jgi:phytoene dehydrogenase-like protein
VAEHVVIGSGINALVAAAMLGAKGHKVTVLEREARLGGCLLTDEVTAPGFRHDVMAATWVLFATGPAFAALGADLARHGFHLSNGDQPTGVLRPDGSALVLTRDRAANVAALNAGHPGDGDRYGAEMAELERDAPFLFALLGSDLWSRGTMRLLAAQAWRRGPRGLAAWVGRALAPSAGWLRATFEGEGAQALLAPWGNHAGLSPEGAYGGMMARVIAFALEGAGAPVVTGGSGRAVEAFRALIEEQGGTFRLGADVVRITHARGRVTGVELASGERIAATSVLASVTPSQLYGRFLADADLPKDRAAVRRFRYGRGNFQLHYALSRPARMDRAGAGKRGPSPPRRRHRRGQQGRQRGGAGDAAGRALDLRGPAPRARPVALPARCCDPVAPGPRRPPRAERGRRGRDRGGGRLDPRGSRGLRGPHRGDPGAPRPRLRRDQARPPGALARRPPSDEREPRRGRPLRRRLLGGPVLPVAALCAFQGAETPIKGLLHIGASTHPGPGLSGGSGFLAAKGLGA